MNIWHSLEIRFANFSTQVSLKRQRQGERITFERGQVGTSENHLKFRSLAVIAGIHLGRLDSRLGLALPLADAAPEVRWCEAIFDVLRLGKPGIHGWGQNEDGTPTEIFSQMDVPDACAASVALCLHLEALEATSLGSSLNERLSSPRYSVVQRHLAKSHALRELGLSELAASAAEAIKALEGLTRVVLNDSSVTLGQAAKSLRGKRNVPAGITKAIEGIWGFGSDSSGIRHAATDERQITPAETTFVVQSCEACIEYLLALDAA